MGQVFCTKKDLIKEALVFGAKTPKDAVVNKLMGSVYKEKFKGNTDMLNRLAGCLSNVTEIKDSYLVDDWVETVKIHRQWDDSAVNNVDGEKNEGNKKKGKGFESKPLVSDVDHHDPDDIVRGNDVVSENEIREANQDPNLKLKNNVKIKIIVSEVAFTKSKKRFRKFVSPILSQLDIIPELGMFHSALMVGPWLCEWNNSALCIPRKCVSRAAMLSADVEQLVTKTEVSDVIKKLAEVIVKWNTTKLYHDTEKDKTKYGNCQDFVNDVLEYIGVKIKTEGPLGKFLTNLRKTGNEKLIFHMDENFREKFKLKEKKVEFKTHKELDEFVNDLQTKYPEFQSHYLQEYHFLKSFDRAFWMKHFKFKDDQNWIPAKKQYTDDDGDIDYELACPFKNPQETFSIRFINS